MKKLLLFCFLLFNVSINFAQNTTLDVSFGTNGKATIPYSAMSGFTALQLTNDGKIVAGGYATPTQGNSNFMICRFDTAGSVDNSFGTNGMIIHDLGTSSNDYITSVAIQPDNKIIAAGYSNANGAFNFTIVRLNTDGTLDNSFGAGGIVYTTISNSSKIYSMKLQPNGKIVAAGVAFTGTNADFALARYNENGILDNTFGTGGIVTSGLLATSQDSAMAVVLQADGKIVTAGRSLDVSLVNVYPFYQTLMRFNTDGTPDITFGTLGIATQRSYNWDFYTTALAIQPDNKIITAARIGNLHSSAYIARYNTNGSIDLSFGDIVEANTGRSGVQTFMGQNNSNDGQTFVYTLGIREDNKIVMGGNYGSTIASIKQLNTNGTTDNAFGTNGLVYLPPPPFYNIREMLILPDGKILAAMENLAINGGVSLFRFLSMGSGGTILPVNLIDFNAYENQGNGILKWSTSIETSHAYFDIERSRDGKQYTVLGKVKSEGNSTDSQNHTFTDKHLEGGSYFYRLKIVDVDSKFVYSPTVMLFVSKANNTLLVSPNPVNRDETLNVTLQISHDQPIIVFITAIDGKVEGRYNYQLKKGTHIITPPIHSLTTGVYTLTIYNNQGNNLFTPQRLMVR